MADGYLTDLAAVLRAAGLYVTELDGWTTRARGSGGYDPGALTHLMVHHTASPPGASGADDAWYCATGDEDAPLCNVYLDRDGGWWVLAAGATNCNGKGGPMDGVDADCMNLHALAVEANGGYGESWPTVQTESYVAGAAALCDAYGLAHVRAHFEWAPTRKIDPAGPSPWADGADSWDMDGFRAAVAANQNGADMSLSDDDVARIAAAVWAHKIDMGTDPDEGNKATWWVLRQLYGMTRQYLGGWQETTPLPERTLLKQIWDAVTK